MSDSAALPTLVLIHDLLSSPAEFGLLTQILEARQVAFDYLEVPGYTRDRGSSVCAWRQWLAAARRAVDERHGDGRGIVVGGLGTGGALAAALALDDASPRVRGVAMLSPIFERVAPRPAALDAAASAFGLDRWIVVQRRDPFAVRNAKTRKWVARELDEQGMSAAGPASVSLRALHESDRLHAHVRTGLARLRPPLLVLHASADSVAPIADVLRIVEPLGDAARLIRLEHSDRMITIDNDRQRVAHELADFVGAPKRRVDPQAANTRVSRVPVAAG